ncbi:hypothetical protein Mapa_001198 [Marchantia paleacea]|nr:hypothetical protein Mapa_001198 [Marchantia paleacea]
MRYTAIPPASPRRDPMHNNNTTTTSSTTSNHTTQAQAGRRGEARRSKQTGRPTPPHQMDQTKNLPLPFLLCFFPFFSSSSSFLSSSLPFPPLQHYLLLLSSTTSPFPSPLLPLPRSASLLSSPLLSLCLPPCVSLSRYSLLTTPYATTATSSATNANPQIERGDAQSRGDAFMVILSSPPP